ncbi:RagB/SusD family nutrient uptake outer membrane protein [Nibrella viscosa]
MSPTIRCCSGRPGSLVTRHLLFPIPLAETDNNPAMNQNPGY